MRAALALASRIGLAGLVVVGAGALAWGLTGDVTATAVPARGWIDQPLDGAALDDGPIEVVVHATAPDGVVSIRLEVDQEEVAMLPADGAVYVEAAWTWQPEVGRHRLTATGVDALGVAGAPGTAVVTVGAPRSAPSLPGPSTEGGASPSAAPSPSERPAPSPSSSTSPAPGGSDTPTTAPSPSDGPSPTPTPATSPSPAPSPSPSPSPTAPACVPAAPTATTQYPKGWFYAFEWTYSGCTPERFEVEVSTSPDFSSIHRSGVVAGDQRVWEDSASAYAACGGYHWRVRAGVGGSTGPWSNVRVFEDCTVH